MNANWKKYLIGAALAGMLALGLGTGIVSILKRPPPVPVTTSMNLDPAQPVKINGLSDLISRAQAYADQPFKRQEIIPAPDFDYPRLDYQKALTIVPKPGVNIFDVEGTGAVPYPRRGTIRHKLNVFKETLFGIFEPFPYDPESFVYNDPKIKPRLPFPPPEQARYLSSVAFFSKAPKGRYPQLAYWEGAGYGRLASAGKGLGDDSVYGASERGFMQIGTEGMVKPAVEIPEKFPELTDIFISRPSPGKVRIYQIYQHEDAVMARQVDLTFGSETVAQVKGRIIPRQGRQIDASSKFGWGFSSMYWRGKADGFTKGNAAHDSDTLTATDRDGRTFVYEIKDAPKMKTPARILDINQMMDAKGKALASWSLEQRNQNASHFIPIAGDSYVKRVSFFLNNIRVERMNRQGNFSLLPTHLILYVFPTQDEYGDNVVASQQLAESIPAGEQVNFSYDLTVSRVGLESGVEIKSIDPNIVLSGLGVVRMDGIQADLVRHFAYDAGFGFVYERGGGDFAGAYVRMAVKETEGKILSWEWDKTEGKELPKKINLKLETDGKTVLEQVLDIDPAKKAEIILPAALPERFTFTLVNEAAQPQKGGTREPIGLIAKNFTLKSRSEIRSEDSAADMRKRHLIKAYLTVEEMRKDFPGIQKQYPDAIKAAGGIYHGALSSEFNQLIHEGLRAAEKFPHARYDVNRDYNFGTFLMQRFMGGEDLTLEDVTQAWKEWFASSDRADLLDSRSEVRTEVPGQDRIPQIVAELRQKDPELNFLHLVNAISGKYDEHSPLLIEVLGKYGLPIDRKSVRERFPIEREYEKVMRLLVQIGEELNRLSRSELRTNADTTADLERLVSELKKSDTQVSALPPLDENEKGYRIENRASGLHAQIFMPAPFDAASSQVKIRIIKQTGEVWQGGIPPMGWVWLPKLSAKGSELNGVPEAEQEKIRRSFAELMLLLDPQINGPVSKSEVRSGETAPDAEKSSKTIGELQQKLKKYDWRTISTLPNRNLDALAPNRDSINGLAQLRWLFYQDEELKDKRDLWVALQLTDYVSDSEFPKLVTSLEKSAGTDISAWTGRQVITFLEEQGLINNNSGRAEVRSAVKGVGNKEFGEITGLFNQAKKKEINWSKIKKEFSDKQMSELMVYLKSKAETGKPEDKSFFWESYTRLQSLVQSRSETRMDFGNQKLVEIMGRVSKLADDYYAEALRWNGETVPVETTLTLMERVLEYYEQLEDYEKRNLLKKEDIQNPDHRRFLALLKQVASGKIDEGRYHVSLENQLALGELLEMDFPQILAASSRSEVRAVKEAAERLLALVKETAQRVTLVQFIDRLENGEPIEEELINRVDEQILQQEETLLQPVRDQYETSKNAGYRDQITAYERAFDLVANFAGLNGQRSEVRSDMKPGITPIKIVSIAVSNNSNELINKWTADLDQQASHIVPYAAMVFSLNEYTANQHLKAGMGLGVSDKPVAQDKEVLAKIQEKIREALFKAGIGMDEDGAKPRFQIMRQDTPQENGLVLPYYFIIKLKKGESPFASRSEVREDIQKQISGLSDSNAQVRKAAAQVLTQAGESAVPALVEVLKNNEAGPYAHYEAALILGKIKNSSQAVILALTGLLRKDNVFLRKAAVSSLGEIGSPVTDYPEPMQVLTKILKTKGNKDREVREAVIHALRKMGPKVAGYPMTVKALTYLTEEEGKYDRAIKRAAELTLRDIQSRSEVRTAEFLLANGEQRILPNQSAVLTGAGIPFMIFAKSPRGTRAWESRKEEIILWNGKLHTFSDPLARQLTERKITTDVFYSVKEEEGKIAIANLTDQYEIVVRPVLSHRISGRSEARSLDEIKSTTVQTLQRAMPFTKEIETLVKEAIEKINQSKFDEASLIVVDVITKVTNPPHSFKTDTPYVANLWKVHAQLEQAVDVSRSEVRSDEELSEEDRAKEEFLKIYDMLTGLRKYVVGGRGQELSLELIYALERSLISLAAFQDTLSEIPVQEWEEDGKRKAQIDIPPDSIIYRYDYAFNLQDGSPKEDEPDSEGRLPVLWKYQGVVRDQNKTAIKLMPLNPQSAVQKMFPEGRLVPYMEFKQKASDGVFTLFTPPDRPESEETSRSEARSKGKENFENSPLFLDLVRKIYAMQKDIEYVITTPRVESTRLVQILGRLRKVSLTLEGYRELNFFQVDEDGYDKEDESFIVDAEKRLFARTVLSLSSAKDNPEMRLMLKTLQNLDYAAILPELKNKDQKNRSEVRQLINPLLLSVQKQVREAGKILGKTTEEIDELLRPENVYKTWRTSSMPLTSGRRERFFIVRSRHRRPFGEDGKQQRAQGGIRIILPEMLGEGPDDSNSDFYQAVKQLTLPDNLQEAQIILTQFLENWVQDEAIALSTLMSFKNKVAALNLGGGKGVILLAHWENADGQWRLVPINDGKFEKRDLAIIMRDAARAFAEEGIIYETIDGGAPDVNPFRSTVTTEQLMGWMVDETLEYLMEQPNYPLWQREPALLEELKVTNDSLMEKPYLETAYSYALRNSKAKDGTVLAVSLPEISRYTGKSVGEGGSLYRGRSTGEGTVMAAEALMRKIEPELVQNERPLAGKNKTDQRTAAIQGFGNVGVYAAYSAVKRGAKLVAISDYSGALYKPEGFSEQDLKMLDPFQQGTAEKKSLLALVDSNKQILGQNHIQLLGKGVAGNHKLLELDVYLLILAALENQIHDRNADKIKARIVSEGANGGTTKEAFQILYDRPEEKRTYVIPSILASAGGVAISSREVEQNFSGNYVGEVALQKWLAEQMQKAVDNVWRIHGEKNVDLGTAAFLVGMEGLIQKPNGSTTGRSELRSAAADIEPYKQIAIKQFVETVNRPRGGGNMRGFMNVTRLITDGLVSMLAYGTDTFDSLLNLFLPSQEQIEINETMPLNAYPKETLEKFEKARKDILGLKSKTQYAYILGPQFALDDGGLAFIRTVFGDNPAAVIIRNQEDRAFVENFNQKLETAGRPAVLIAEDVTEAEQKLRSEIRQLSGIYKGSAFTFQGIVSTTEIVAEALKEALRDQVVLVTPQIFERFTQMTGIAALVDEFKAQFQLLKSA